MAAQLLGLIANSVGGRREESAALTYVPQLNALTAPRVNGAGAVGAFQWLLAVPEFAFHVIAEEDLDGIRLEGRSTSDVLAAVDEAGRRIGAKSLRIPRAGEQRFGHPDPTALAEIDRYMRNTARVLNRLRASVAGAGPVQCDAAQLALTIAMPGGGRRTLEAGLCAGSKDAEPFWFVGSPEQPLERVTATDLLRRGEDAEVELEAFLRVACERRVSTTR